MSETMMSRRTALRTTALSAIGYGLMGPICAPPVAAETPAEEAERLLARVESLLLNELRPDDEARGGLVGWTQYLYDLATAADPRYAMMIDWSTREPVPTVRPTA